MSATQILLLVCAAMAASGAIVLRFVSTAKEMDSEFGVLDDGDEVDEPVTGPGPGPVPPERT